MSNLTNSGTFGIFLSGTHDRKNKMQENKFIDSLIVYSDSLIVYSIVGPQVGGTVPPGQDVQIQSPHTLIVHPQRSVMVSVQGPDAFTGCTTAILPKTIPSTAKDKSMNFFMIT